MGRLHRFHKDYIDLYFVIAERHATLRDIIERADKKFGTEFNSRLFVEQLVFLDDVQDVEVQFLKEVVTPDQVISFFERQIQAELRA